MDRVIKFRFWDKRINEFITNVGFGMNHGGVLTDGEETSVIIITQFTGGTDEMDVEVYEGDIVYYGGEHIVVEYDNDLCGFILNTYHSTQMLHNLIKECMVVGNKFQNPDLLD